MLIIHLLLRIVISIWNCHLDLDFDSVIIYNDFFYVRVKHNL